MASCQTCNASCIMSCLEQSSCRPILNAQLHVGICLKFVRAILLSLSVRLPPQVMVQLTVRLQGSALLTFSADSANATLAALAAAAPGLAAVGVQLQHLAHFACADAVTLGVGCQLGDRQAAAGEQALPASSCKSLFTMPYFVFAIVGCRLRDIRPPKCCSAIGL